MHEYLHRLKRLIKISEASRNIVSDYGLRMELLNQFLMSQVYFGGEFHDLSYKKNYMKIEFHNSNKTI